MWGTGVSLGWLLFEVDFKSFSMLLIMLWIFGFLVFVIFLINISFVVVHILLNLICFLHFNNLRLNKFKLIHHQLIIIRHFLLPLHFIIKPIFNSNLFLPFIIIHIFIFYIFSWFDLFISFFILSMMDVMLPGFLMCCVVMEMSTWSIYFMRRCFFKAFFHLL